MKYNYQPESFKSSGGTSTKNTFSGDYNQNYNQSTCFFDFTKPQSGCAPFFASLFAGLLWTYISPQAPFIFGSVIALIACVVFIVFGRGKNGVEQVRQLQFKIKQWRGVYAE